MVCSYVLFCETHDRPKYSLLEKISKPWPRRDERPFPLPLCNVKLIRLAFTFGSQPV